VFFIPVVLLLPRLMELWGVMLAQPLADVLTFAVAVPLLLRVLGQMKRAEEAAGA